MTASARTAPWERMPGESWQAYEAFGLYRDAGHERSLMKASASVRKNAALIKRWSARWSWVVRAQAWDSDQERSARQVAQKARLTMLDRHARLAAAMQSKIVDRLQNLDPAKLSPRELAYWLEVTSKVERAARGEPDRLEVSGPNGGPIELAQMTDEERRARMIELRHELDARLDEPVSA